MGHVLIVTLVFDRSVAIVKFAFSQSFQLPFQEIMNGNFGGDIRERYIGHEAQHMRGVLTLKHPIKNGIICNWDEMERVSRNAFVTCAVCYNSLGACTFLACRTIYSSETVM